MVDHHIVEACLGTTWWTYLGGSSGPHPERLWHLHRMHGTGTHPHHQEPQAWWQNQHWGQSKRQGQAPSTSTSALWSSAEGWVPAGVPEPEIPTQFVDIELLLSGSVAAGPEEFMEQWSMGPTRLVQAQEIGTARGPSQFCGRDTRPLQRGEHSRQTYTSFAGAQHGWHAG